MTRLLALAALAVLALGAVTGAGCRSRHLPEGGAEPVAAPAGATSGVLCDFEHEGDAEAWSGRGAELERVAERASSGRWAGRLSFRGGERGPKVALAESCAPGLLPGDWSAWDELVLDLHNPGTRTERLRLRLADGRGETFTESAFLPPGWRGPVRIPLAAARGAIDLAQVEELRLFRWNPPGAATFYLDHVRLERGPRAIAPTPVAATTGRAAGFLVGIESASTKVFREPDRFRGERRAAVALDLARNEVESFQAVLASERGERLRVRVERGDLVRADGGARIAADQLRVREVGYVQTTKPDYPVSHVGWWPDPLLERSAVDLVPGTLTPLWVDVRTTAATGPGIYRGELRLVPERGDAVAIALEVRVRDFVLPVRSHLATAFDLYDGRMRRAYQNWVPGGSERWQGRWEELEHRYFLALLDHRMSPIWHADPARDPDFRERLGAYRERGLNAFGVSDRGGRVDNVWPAGDDELGAVAARYRDMERELEGLGALADAYVYSYDEPAVGTADVARVASALARAAPGLRNLVVIQHLTDPRHNPEWWRDIDIVVVHDTAAVAELLAPLRDQGKEIWLYTSAPMLPHPTLQLDAPAMSARVLPWLCWKSRASGYLFWAVNFWVENPWQDPFNPNWKQNGNGALFYPGEEGPVDSIRVEAFRDGMEDYEYLHRLDELVRRLRQDAARRADPAVAKAVAAAEVALAIPDAMLGPLGRHAHEPALLLERRRALADAIEALSALEPGR